MLQALLLLGLLLPAARASSSVADARPSLLADDQPLTWWDGGPAFLLASARGVRINFRGVFPLHSPLRTDLQGTGWAKAPCNESAFALCSSDSGEVFPAQRPRVVDGAQQLQDGWRALSCRRSAEKVLVRELAYDISACDVLDEGLDVLYSNGTLYFRPADLPQWEYVLSVVLCIVLTRALSFNVQSLLRPGTPVLSQAPGLVATGTILVLVCRDGDAPYVTLADLRFFYVSIALVAVYVALYTAEYLARHGAHGHSPVSSLEALVDGIEKDIDPYFTLLIAGLQLAILRFYRTVDSPYAPVLLGMLVARLWIKVRGVRWPLFAPGSRRGRWALTGHATLLLDALYVSFYIQITARALGFTHITIHAAGWGFSEIIESQRCLNGVTNDDGTRPGRASHASRGEHYTR